MNPIEWLGSLFSPADKRSLSRADLFRLIGDGPSTYAGPAVSEESALRYSAVYACVRIISESIAALPLPLMRRSGRDKERASDHPLYSVLHDMASPEMTSFDWRELMFSHLLTWGNGYSEKEYNARGQIIALWPLRPDKVEGINRNAQGQLEYIYRLPDNSLRVIPWWRIHHIKGPGDALLGHSPIRLAARQAVGLGLATEEYGARFFSNGAKPGAVLKHPGKLSAQALERLRESLASENQGLSNSHRTKILEEGMDIATIGIPPNEAQFLETRKFQITEIARIYRVPPHMLADLDRATFSNIEHQSLNFVMHTLLPWLVRHEQAIYRDLLTPDERRTLYAKYVVAGMLRGDFATRSQGYATGINTGYYTRNEVRELEDMNPLEGLDKPLMPLNMIEVGATPPAPAQAVPGANRAQGAPASQLIDREERATTTRKDRQALINRHVRLFEEAAGRAVKREVSDIRKAIPRHLGKRSVASFETWLAGFYEQMRDWLPDYFRALMLSYFETIMASVAEELDGDPAQLDDEAREWIEGYLANFTEVYAVGGEKQLRALLAEAEAEEQSAAEAIEDRLTGWEETKATKAGLEQAFEAGNALAILGYTVAGVTILRWSARGESCPLCKKMDGRRIKVGGSFLDEGDEMTAEGVDPLPIIRKIKHGPLHSGCDCVVIAG